MLAPLLYNEPPSLLVAEIKFSHGGRLRPPSHSALQRPRRGRRAL